MRSDCFQCYISHVLEFVQNHSPLPCKTVIAFSKTTGEIQLFVGFFFKNVFARASTVQIFPDTSALYLMHLHIISWDFLCCYTVPKTQGHLPLQHCPNYIRLDRMAPVFHAAGRDLLRVPSCPLLPKHPLMDASTGWAGALQCPLVQAYSQEKYPLPI